MELGARQVWRRSLWAASRFLLSFRRLSLQCGRVCPDALDFERSSADCGSAGGEGYRRSMAGRGDL